MAWLRFMALAILAVWIGGLAILGGIAAPVIFSVLEAHDPIAGRELAGAVFGAVFQQFLTIASICGGLFLALLGLRAARGPRPRRLGLRAWTVVAMLAISIGSSVLLVPRIDILRTQTPGPIASLRPDDPRRVEFGRLHGLSNGLMLLTLVAGLGLLWLEAQDMHHQVPRPLL